MQNKTELQLVYISTDKRVWLRVKDPGSSKRTICEESFRILQLFRSWISTVIPTRPLTPKDIWPGQAAPDACAAGVSCQLGGFIAHPSGWFLWFSERFHHSDFNFLPFELDSNMQKNISVFETLGQIGLLWLIASDSSGFRIPICLKSLSDNSGAEASSNRMFTTTKLLCFFAEILAHQPPRQE